MNLDCMEQALGDATTDDVERALDRDLLDDRDIGALLSSVAVPYLERMAQKTAALTRQRFGRTMQLYAPLYLSNECVNHCAYCGFSHELEIHRRTLTPEAAATEAEWLHAQGFRHLLLVSGEAPRTVGVGYLETVARLLRPRFASLSIETGTFGLDGFRRLVEAGVDGLAIYQETYLPTVYDRVHRAGPKRRGDKRLEAIESGGKAGFRTLGIGVLLGLGPWQIEACHLSAHARALGTKYWRSRIAVSFPRIQTSARGFVPPHPVSDRELVQMVCAMRLALPDADLVLSTREPAHLRDELMGLGITRMSAGSRTNPGGYSHADGLDESGAQFSVGDSRTASDVARALSARGLEPVWKDFDRAFLWAPPGNAS